MNTNEIDLDRSERLASKIIAMVRQKQEKIQETPQFVEIQDQRQKASQQSINTSQRETNQQNQDDVEPAEENRKIIQIEDNLDQLDNLEGRSSEFEESYNQNSDQSAQKKENEKTLTAQYRMLRQFFTQFLKSGLQKFQEITNAKLKQVVKRIVKIQTQLVKQPSLQNGLSHLMKTKLKEVQAHPNQLSELKGQRKRHKYIKSWQKLEYVREIEKGKRTIRGVAKELKLKESIVHSWINNKKQFLKKSKFPMKSESKVDDSDSYNSQQDD